MAGRRWLSRFVDPRVVRERGAFHLHAARDAESGAPRLVVVPATGTDSHAAAACLDDAAAACEAMAAPPVPRVAARGRAGGVDFLALDCDAVIDLESLAGLAARQGARRLPTVCGSGFATTLGEALRRAHAAAPPRHLMGLCWANLLIGAGGRLWFLGHGHNLLAFSEHGVPTGAGGFFQAPEVVSGAPPTVASDVYATLSYMRSLFALVELPPAYARILQGRPLAEDTELLQLFAWSNQRVLAFQPADRETDLELVDRQQRRAIEILGLPLDPAATEQALAGFLAELGVGSSAAPAAPAPPSRPPPSSTPRSRFLGRFVDAAPLREHGPFRWVSCREPDDGAERLVVCARRDVPGAADALAAHARATAAVISPHVPAVVARGETPELAWVAFAADACTDLDELCEACERHGLKLPTAVLGQVAAVLLETAAVAHTPAAGPTYVDGVGAVNFLVARDGRLKLLLHGVNPFTTSLGGVRPFPRLCVAPEVVAGARPTAVSDFYVGQMLTRSILPWVEVPAALARVMQGEYVAADLEIAEILAWSFQHVVADLPAARTTDLARITAKMQRLLELLGAPMAADAADVAIARLLRATGLDDRRRRAAQPAEDEAVALADKAALVVAEDGSWFRPPSRPRVSLARRANLRGLLVRLAEARLAQPGLSVAPDALIDAGWPGERILPDAAKNRLYVAVTTLRKLGLKDLLESRGDGYALAAGTPVRRAR